MVGPFPGLCKRSIDRTPFIRSRTGRKGPYAAYYVHLQPGSCFVGESSPESHRPCPLKADPTSTVFCARFALIRPDSRQPFWLHHVMKLRRRLWLLRELVAPILPESRPFPPLSPGHDLSSSQRWCRSQDRDSGTRKPISLHFFERILTVIRIV